MSYQPEIFFAISPFALCIIDPQGFFIQINPAMEKCLGYASESLISQNIKDLTHPDDARFTWEAFENAKTSLSKNVVVNRFGFSGKNYQKTQWQVSYASNDDHFYAIVNLVEQSITFNHQQNFQVDCDTFPLGILITNDAGDCIFSNRSFQIMTGLASSCSQGELWKTLVVDEDRDLVLFELEKQSRESSSTEFRIKQPSGNIKWLKFSSSPLFVDKLDASKIIIAEDITQLKLKINAQIEQLTQQATTDSLTQLKNRPAFEEQLALQLSMSLRHNTPLSIILLDVDSLKQHNDMHGHAQGDQVLKSIGQLLQENTRGHDFACRYGGDEFTILLTQSNTQNAIQAGNRLHAAIEQHSWPVQNITVSLGIATIDGQNRHSQDITSIAQLIMKQADIALYLSKDSGKNCVKHYEQALNS